MSTRRPRIKAVVASLPVRRKNVEAKPKSPATKSATSDPERGAISADSPASPPRNLPVTAPTQCKLAEVPSPCNPPSAAQSPRGLPAPPQPPAAVPCTPNCSHVELSLKTQAAAVDGIVPLAAPQSRADLLKSEIISESAEVLFDPIVPLPSPSKPRVKLRPAPRLPPAPPAPPLSRRSSLHGSASESEEERGRGVGGRVRHDSHSSVTTQSQTHTVRDSGRSRHDSSSSAALLQAPTPALTTAVASAASPTKDKHLSRMGHGGRRGGGGGAAPRRKQHARDGVQRDQLTMYDLIFYNPTTNPIVESESGKSVCNKTEKAEAKAEKETEDAEAGGDEEDEDEPMAPAPAPQIKIGPDGEVMVDEKSLVIKQTSESRRLSSTVVRETAWAQGGGGPGGRYSRVARTRSWCDAETVRFYRALAALGTDFSLMTALFPDRTRRDLKMKFKKEERSNGAQIDRALSTRLEFAIDALAAQFARERRDATRAAADERRATADARRAERDTVQRARRRGFRLNKAGKAAVELMPEQRGSSSLTSADDLIAFDAEAARACPPTPPTRKRKQSAPKATAPPVAIAPVPPTPRALRKADGPQAFEVPPDVNPLALAPNVAPGSLVCLTIADPQDAGKKVLQTYVANGEKLTPVTVPPHMLSYVMEYVAKASASTPSSPVSAGTARHRRNSYTMTSL